MTPVLRQAVPADAQTCAAILGDWITRTAWMPRLHTPAQDAAYLGRRIGLGQVTVAERAGAIVGYLVVRPGWIDHLYVAAALRGRAIGTALVTDVQAVSDALDLWCFAANTGAQRFYARLGFVMVQRTDGAGNEEGLPDIRYAWRRRT